MATSISALPNELSDIKENVEMDIKDKTNIKANPPIAQQIRSNDGGQVSELSKDSINKIIQGLQDASQSGSTALQSRDIPLQMDHITHDFTAKPNYVPSPEADKLNYIQDEETMETLIKQKKDRQKNKMDFFYDEIQTPLLIMVMFFTFQLPIFKKSMATNFPAFFLRSGAYNLKGLIFITMLYGGSYYGIIKTIKYLSEI